MDGSTGQVQLDPSKLNTADRKELTQFIANEAQKTNIQSSNFAPPKPAFPLPKNRCGPFISTLSFHFNL
jgi:hypothetical protein